MEIKNRLVFHAKTGGDLEGDAFHLGKCGGAFFATSAEAATAYALHAFWVDYTGHGSHDEFIADYLGEAPVLFPVRLTIDNPAVLDRNLLYVAAEELSVPASERFEFANDFEDSIPEARERVLGWARSKGYDGAYLPRDSMPEPMSDDLCLRECFVAFQPETQVVFALSAHGDASCRWSAEADLEQLSKKIDYADLDSDSDCDNAVSHKSTELSM
jgi:hypothetical protein